MLVPEILTIVTWIAFSSASSQCSHGEVRLVNGTVPNEGRVEVCVNSNWETICEDDWNTRGAKVVCRQLGYTPEGAQALLGGYFGQGNGSAVLSNVRCEPSRHMTILECCNRKQHRNCYRDDSAGVRCEDDQLIKNVSATLIDTQITNSALTHYNVLIIWQLQWNSLRNTTSGPCSFGVRCFNEMHSIKLSCTNTTFTIQIGGLLPGSSYSCCVSAVYDLYTAKGVCTQTETPEFFTPEIIESLNAGSRASSSRSMNIILFAVLGSIAAFLIVLSTLLCVVLIYQIRKRTTKNVQTKHAYTRSLQLDDRCSMDVSTHNNASYDIVMVPSRSKDNKAPNSNNKETSSSKATLNSCERMYDSVDLRKQAENEELQLYEIPDHESSRDAEESYIYY